MDNTQPVLAAWAASSADSTKIANTIKGLATALASSIVLYAGIQFHIQVNPVDVVSFVSELGTAIGLIWGIAGFIIKIVHGIAKKS